MTIAALAFFLSLRSGVGCDGAFVAVAPRGARVAVSSTSGAIRIVDVEQRVAGPVLSAPSGPVNRLAWSADAGTLAAARSPSAIGGSATITAWNAANGTPLVVLAVTGEVSGLELDARGRHALDWSCEGPAHVRALPAGRCHELDTGRRVRAAAFVPESDVVVLADSGGELSTWSISSGLRIASSGCVKYAFSSLCVLPDGGGILAGTELGWLGAWSLPDLEPRWWRRFAFDPLWSDGDFVASLAVAPDGVLAAASIRSWHAIEVFEVASGTTRWKHDFQAGCMGPADVRIDPSGRRLAVVHCCSVREIRDLAAGTVLASWSRLQLLPQPGSLDWTGDGRFVVLGTWSTGALGVVDHGTLGSLGEIPLPP